MTKENFNNLLLQEIKMHLNECEHITSFSLYEEQIKERINNTFNYSTLLNILSFDEIENVKTSKNTSLFGAYLTISFTIRFYIKNTYDKISYNTSFKITL